jgi:hypothetical protein
MVLTDESGATTTEYSLIARGSVMFVKDLGRVTVLPPHLSATRRRDPPESAGLAA